MSEKMSKSESAKAFMEFCSDKLTELGIESHVTFAEIDGNSWAVGKTDFAFDLEIIKAIFAKNGVKPNLITATSADDLKKRLQQLVNKLDAKNVKDGSKQS